MEARNMVKISFDRSDETLRCSLVPHISAAFGRKGISVLNDKHDEFCESVASVLIFSKNYVSSKESLDDFLNTIRRRNDKGHLVTTVFYGVSISNLQELKGNFAKRFFEHRTSYQASQWHNAHAEIGNLPGHEQSNNQSDCEFVEKIARDVYEKIFPKERIGVYSRMLPDIENLLCKQQWGVKRIGIWGMPGIGKTTLAQAVFDQMSGDYEVTCFVQNFHETFQEKGLRRLLQEHFNDLTDPKLQQRVLVVLDDVRNHLDAEFFLAGFVSFSLGSVIIVTSRDEQVLCQCQVNQTYKVEGLNKHEALKLFSWCAFGRDVREKNLLPELSMKVIEYANGNPLALRVYGEEISSKKNEKPNQEEEVFLKLKQDPPHQIMEVVKSSYDELSDNEKNILVYIAFFFTGKNVDCVSELLQDLGLFPHVGIDRLVENSLVTISDNRLEMHSMIQSVVKNIGRCQISEDPKTSFKCLLGTKDIEAISLDASNVHPNVNLSSFRSMYNLRYLKIFYSKPESENNRKKALESLSLPYGLRFLHWEHYPLQSLPQDFDPSNLVEIDMPHSQLQTLWGGTKNLKMLKRINLRHSQKLLEVNELSEALNLEKIDLCGCKNLQSFPVIRKLQKLRVVDLPGGTWIKISPEFPSNVEWKIEGSSIDDQRKPLKSEPPPEPQFLNLLKERSFLSSQERLKEPDMVESTPTFKDMLCENVFEISRRSVEWAQTNLFEFGRFW
uniref:Putative WRKY transcription factor 16 n=1 Tax=Noccaea caerulescens TaxID=107243 RepID=A0A1J3EHK6_NOCCA